MYLAYHRLTLDDMQQQDLPLFSKAGKTAVEVLMDRKVLMEFH
jgi:hypothetical protein